MILQKDIPLKDYSNYKIGGNAKYFFEFKSKKDLVNAIDEYKKVDPSLKSVFILGKGTNVLFSDDGFDGLVLKNELSGIKLSLNEVLVNSGTLVDELVTFTLNNALSGFEWAGGLPGSLGGAIRGNAGAFGGEIKDNLIEATSINLKNLKTITRNNSECKFSYRQSIFKTNDGLGEVILFASFAVRKTNKDEIDVKTNENINYRKMKHPLEYPNIGSTFKNIPIEKVPKDVLEEFKKYIKNDPFPVLPVAKLIASTDLIGKRVGNAKVSEKHPNFIVNLGGASSKDVLGLIIIMKKELEAKYRISLEEEIIIL